MTEEQKRYKISKRTRYEEQISQENKNAIIKTFSFGFSAAAALISLSASLHHEYLATKIFDLVIGIFNTGYAAYHLKGLIESISKKTMFQGKVEDIDVELEIPEEEKCKVLK